MAACDQYCSGPRIRFKTICLEMMEMSQARKHLGKSTSKDMSTFCKVWKAIVFCLSFSPPKTHSKTNDFLQQSFPPPLPVISLSCFGPFPAVCVLQGMKHKKFCRSLITEYCQQNKCSVGNSRVWKSITLSTQEIFCVYA